MRWFAKVKVYLLFLGIILLALPCLRAIGSAVPDTVDGNYRGYLTTPQELAVIKQKAAKGIEPYKSAVTQVITQAQIKMPPSSAGVVTCNASTSPPYLIAGGPQIYSYALAYHLAGDAKYAQKAKEAIAELYKITEFVASGDGPIVVGRHLPDFIRAADLLEHYWSKSDKRAFQDWLAAKAAPLMVIEMKRANNHGSVASNGLMYVADYLYDRPDLRLGGRTPAETYRGTRQDALDRCNGLIWEDARCPEGIAMIRPDGGIPDEMRRSTDCNDTHIALDSSAQEYSEGHVCALASQAELCLRRGDSSLFDNIMTEAGQTPGGKLLPAGRGSMRKAIEFVMIANNLPWRKKQTLMIAARYYRTPEMLAQARAGRPHGGGTGDRVNHFTTLSHDFAEGEIPGLPPTVPAPGD